jgi:hypothetical protein
LVSLSLLLILLAATELSLPLLQEPTKRHSLTKRKKREYALLLLFILLSTFFDLERAAKRLTKLLVYLFFFSLENAAKHLTKRHSLRKRENKEKAARRPTKGHWSSLSFLRDFIDASLSFSCMSFSIQEKRLLLLFLGSLLPMWIRPVTKL